MTNPPLSDFQLTTLIEQGYLVVPAVLDLPQVNHCEWLFRKWLPLYYGITTGAFQRLNTNYSGHTQLAWQIRTHPTVQVFFN